MREWRRDHRVDRCTAEIRITRWLRSEGLGPGSEHQQRLSVSARQPTAEVRSNVIATEFIARKNIGGEAWDASQPNVTTNYTTKRLLTRPAKRMHHLRRIHTGAAVAVVM